MNIETIYNSMIKQAEYWVPKDTTQRRMWDLYDKGALADIYNGLIAGSLSGVGAGSLTYSGLGAIPALKKRKLLRALVAATAGVGVGTGVGLGVGTLSNIDTYSRFKNLSSSIVDDYNSIAKKPAAAK